MSGKIIDYTVVCITNRQEVFEEQVNKLIWLWRQPNWSISSVLSSSENITWSQAMVKYESLSTDETWQD